VFFITRDREEGALFHTLFDAQKIMIVDLSGNSSSSSHPRFRGGRDSQSTMAIGKFAHNQGMSVEDTTELLGLIQNLGNIHVAKLQIEFPHLVLRKPVYHKSGRRLLEQVTKDPHDIFKTVRRQVYLPEEWIGRAASRARPINEEKVNVANLVAHAFLTVDKVSNFKTSHERMVNKAGDRILGPFHSGDLFPKLIKLVNEKFGDGFVPCCYGLYWDKTQLNKSASRNRIPLSVVFLSMTGTDFRHIFVGYVTDELPYSDKEMYELMTKQGVDTDVDREYLLKKMKHQLMLNYITWAVEDLTIRQEQGCKVQIGMGLPDQGDSIVLRVVFFPVLLSTDNMETIYSVQVSYMSNDMPCRVCTASGKQTHCFVPLQGVSLRDTKLEEKLSTNASRYNDEYILFCIRCRQLRQTVNKMHPSRRAGIEEARLHGQTPSSGGKNPLYNLFRATTYAGTRRTARLDF
jgi:hypothetical protein